MPNQQQQQIPDLGGIITQKDLYQKGKFDYCAWAKTAQIIREKAPNWFFSLEPNSEGEIVWKAPNNTGFMMGYFQNILTGTKLPLFPYAITDFNNRPIVYEKISSNDIQNSQRRHLCACACYSLGFGHELWAQIEIKGLDQPEAETKPQTSFSSNKKTGFSRSPSGLNKKTEPPKTSQKKEESIDPKVLDQIKVKLADPHLSADNKNHAKKLYKAKFNISSENLAPSHIQTKEQGDYMSHLLDQYQSA